MRFRNNASAQNDMLLSAVRNAFERMGKTLPKPATEPRDMSEVFAQPGALREAATAAILAGRDPLADEAVKRAQLGAQLAAAGVYEAVKDAEQRAYFEQLTEAGAELIATVTAEFDAAVTVLKDAATQLGKVDLHGPLSQSAGMSASNAALLARAAAAHRTVEATREQWPVALQVGGGEIGVNDQYRPLIWLDLTAEQLEAWNDGQYPNRGAYASTEWHRPDSWDAVHDGLTLDLVDSVDQLEARVAAVNEQRQRAEAERRAENFRRGGLGV